MHGRQAYPPTFAEMIPVVVSGFSNMPSVKAKMLVEIWAGHVVLGHIAYSIDFNP